MSRGFASIGLIRPKNHENVGSVLRAAGCYSAKSVSIENDRSSFVRSHVDTMDVWKHTPVFHGDDIQTMIPFGTTCVAVDLVEGAESLITFQHPMSAFYIFGPEDGTLGPRILELCQKRVMVPTKHCMNLAATVNVVLYDRMAKADRMARGVRYKDLGQEE